MATKTPTQRDICALVTDRIDVGALAEGVRSDASGAVATFSGVVRNHHRGEAVDRLEYEAYGPMAEEQMRRIAEELRARWPLEGVAIVHRLGTLEVGEVSVAVAVASAHRRDALEACAFAIDRLKESLPVWKKEHGRGGRAWVIGDDSPRALPPVALPAKNRSARRRDDA